MTNKRPLLVHTAGEALQPQPPPDWIVENLFEAGAVCCFFGDGGAKKTYSLLSMAVCVASGLPWLQFKTHKSPVLFVDEESGRARFLRRLGEVLRGEDCGEDTPLHFVTLPGLLLDGKKQPGDIAYLAQAITETGARLVIIDALVDVMSGDENSVEDLRPVFIALRKISEDTGASIVVIHHSNKGGGYRGSSALKGAVDLLVKVESEPGKNTIDFTTEKNRDGEADKWGAVATWLELEGTFTLRPYSVRNEHFTTAERYVLEYLEEHGASPLPDIAGAADVCEPAKAQRAVYSLTGKKKVYRTNPQDKGRGAIAIYDIVRGNE